MKLWLDDELPVPNDTWTLVKTVEEAKEVLLAASSSGYENIEHVSLDYVLVRGTGQDVLEWMIETGIQADKMTTHSGSWGGRQLLIDIAEEAGITLTVYNDFEDN